MTPQQFWHFAIKVESGPAVHHEAGTTWTSSHDPGLGVVTVDHVAKTNRSIVEAVTIRVEMDDDVAEARCDLDDLRRDRTNAHHFVRAPSVEFCIKMVMRFSGFLTEGDS